MNKIPCGGFNIGEGLSIDPFTRTLSAPGGVNSTNTIHFTLGENDVIQSADKTIDEIIKNSVMNGAYNCEPFGVLYSQFTDNFQGETEITFFRIDSYPSFVPPDHNQFIGCDLTVTILKGTKTPDGDVWKIYPDNYFFVSSQKGIWLRSAGGKTFKLQVDDQGAISTTEVHR